METTIVHRGYIGIMENKMDTTIGFRTSGSGFAFWTRGLGSRSWSVG